jgi:hypothetical protein
MPPTNLRRETRVFRRGPAPSFALDPNEPAELAAHLLDGQPEHPDRFVKLVADLAAHGRERGLFARQLLLEERATPLQLPLEDAGPREPRQRHPCEKRRPLALPRPVAALERVRERRGAGRRRRVDAPFGPCRRRIGLGLTNEAEARELLQRVVDLRPRHRGPVLHLPPFELRPHLVAVHRALGEQAEHDEVGRRQGSGHWDLTRLARLV